MGGNGCNSEIVKYYVVQPAGGGGSITGSTGDFIVGGDLFVCGTGSTIYTNTIEPCDPNSGVTISNITTFYPNGNILPTNDNVVNLGTPSRRFRDVNTVSGTSTVWTSTNQVITPNLNLGLDGLGNQRTITANNSVIQNDILDGDTY
jgi:hypothetical protein